MEWGEEGEKKKGRTRRNGMRDWNEGRKDQIKKRRRDCAEKEVMERDDDAEKEKG